MIVYHLTTDEHIPRLLAEGLQRAERRFYVFAKWNLIRIMLEAQVQGPSNTRELIFEKYKVLVINADEDTLVQGPMPKRLLPTTFKPEEEKLLQSKSLYLETDLAPEQIMAVKDPCGHDVTKHFTLEERRGKPLWRFLSYLRPYWTYVALGTTAGIIKFLIPGGLQEKIAGVSIIKGFTREAEETKAFASQANKLYNKVLRSAHYAAINEMIVGFIYYSAPVLVVWYGANQIMHQSLTVGQLTQFLLYLSMFYAPLQRLSDLGVMLATSLSAIERIFEYFDLQPQVGEDLQGTVLPTVEGYLEFDKSKPWLQPMLWNLWRSFPGLWTEIVPRSSIKSTPL